MKKALFHKKSTNCTYTPWLICIKYNPLNPPCQGEPSFAGGDYLE